MSLDGGPALIALRLQGTDLLLLGRCVPRHAGETAPFENTGLDLRWFSQLPCLGVEWNSSWARMRRAYCGEKVS